MKRFLKKAAAITLLSTMVFSTTSVFANTQRMVLVTPVPASLVNVEPTETFRASSKFATNHDNFNYTANNYIGNVAMPYTWSFPADRLQGWRNAGYNMGSIPSEVHEDFDGADVFVTENGVLSVSVTSNVVAPWYVDVYSGRVSGGNVHYELLQRINYDSAGFTEVNVSGMYFIEVGYTNDNAGLKTATFGVVLSQDQANELLNTHGFAGHSAQFVANVRQAVVLPPYIAAAGMQVKGYPDASAAAFAYIERGEVVPVVGKVPHFDEWYKIDYNGREGYVPVKSVALSRNLNISSASALKTVNTHSLNVRSSASVSNNVIGVLTRGAAVSVLGTTAGWTRISYDGREAFIDGRYLR